MNLRSQNSPLPDHVQRMRAPMLAVSILTLAVASLLAAQHAQTTQNFYLSGLALALCFWLVYRQRHIFVGPVISIEEPLAKTLTADENQKLAVNFQSRGQLNAAFTLFKQCTPNEQIIKLLYNLACDYELLKQYPQANEVYQYIALSNPDYLDVRAKLDTMEVTHIEETAQLQGREYKKPLPNSPMGVVSEPLFHQRYKIEKTLGKGANSIVHFALDTLNNNAPVALKIMQFSSSAEHDQVQNELRRRFIQEAKTAAQINHPNTIRIFDSGEFEGIAFIAMEYLQGQNLRTFSYPEKRLPAETVLELLAQCAEALAHAHEKGIIHRDVKPANILYDAQNKTVKLTDFGIAKISDSTQTLEGAFLGTPLYMSPEQLAGKKLDPRSDIFSLGATAFRLLSGQPPFPGNTLGDLMRAITSQPHQDLQSFCPALPQALIEVIDCALAKDPSERYQDGHQMAAALRACVPLLLQSDCA